jgi:hypothetical protein
MYVLSILNRTSSTMHTSHCTPVRLVMWKFSWFCGQTFFVSPFFCVSSIDEIDERFANEAVTPTFASFHQHRKLNISLPFHIEHHHILVRPPIVNSISKWKNRCACFHDFVIVSNTLVCYWLASLLASLLLLAVSISSSTGEGGFEWRIDAILLVQLAS